MVMADRSASLALLMSFVFGVTDAIRPLKDGPMIDAEGREYKSAPLRAGAENLSRPQFTGGPSVRVQCTETSMIVVVKADLNENGRRLSPGDVFLGEAEHWQSSRCRAAAAGDTEHVIEAGLQDCGFKLTIFEDSVIYSNKLVISPAARYHGISRMSPAVVPVSCHYKRVHLVSSNAQQMTFPPPAEFSSGRSAFSLQLITGETFSSVFHLGDLMHLEASYTGPYSGQRRLFVDSCVATLSPDPTSVPRYYFIENHGCLIDAKEEGSKAQFQPGRRTSSLQLQLDAFLFEQDSRNSIFITCQLKAIPEMLESSPVNKACNYEHSRWRNLDGNDEVCHCCDGTCSNSFSKRKDETNLRRLIPEDPTACATVTLGPLKIIPSK